MFTFFRPRRALEFNIGFDIKPFEAEVSVETMAVIKRFHHKIKKTIERYSYDLTRRAERDFSNNPKKIRHSCVELCVLYYHSFMNEFEKNNISPAIVKMYFAPVFSNFISLNPTLEELGYRDLHDFFKVKEMYFRRIHDAHSRVALSHYFLHSLLKFPLMQPDEYAKLPPYFDFGDYRQHYYFFLNLSAKIKHDAVDMMQKLHAAQPVHYLQHSTTLGHSY